MRKLKSCGVDGSNILRTFKPTTTKVRIISGHQQMLRLDFEVTTPLDDSHEHTFLNNFSAAVDNFDAVIISDYGKGFCTDNICRAIISLCRLKHKIVTVDPKGDYWDKYRCADFITPNLKEFNSVLTNKISNVDSQVEKSARDISDKFNLSGLLVTRSSEGLTLVDADKVFHVRAHAQEVFDVSCQPVKFSMYSRPSSSVTSIATIRSFSDFGNHFSQPFKSSVSTVTLPRVR